MPFALAASNAVLNVMGSDGTVLLALLETAVDGAVVDDEGGLMDDATLELESFILEEEEVKTDPRSS